MAKLDELINKCDQSEMFTQNLFENASSMEVKGKNGYITFLTNPEFIQDELLGKRKKVAFVVWLPEDVFQR